MIHFSGQEIPKSPYKVNVEGAPGDPSKVTAAGPGLEPHGLQAGKKTFFEVYTAGNCHMIDNDINNNDNISMTIYQ